jgi:CRISPR-associated protein Cas5d
MTPSAARGVLEAIFWKPECAWRVREIHVLRPIRYLSMVRNEVNSRQAERSAQERARSGRGGYDSTGDRAQRHTLALRDVAYLIKADVVLREQPAADAAKYRDQFRRRVQRGQCFATPYLGTRECAASFGPADGSERPITSSEGLGRMLFDVWFPTGADDRGQPVFFDAELREGVLHVPSELYNRAREG